MAIKMKEIENGDECFSIRAEIQGVVISIEVIPAQNRGVLLVIANNKSTISSYPLKKTFVPTEAEMERIGREVFAVKKDKKKESKNGKKTG